MSNYITIPLSKQGKHKGKFETIVDLVDADLAEFNWSVQQTGLSRYVMRTIQKRTVNMHRIILARKLERDLLPNECVDHINNNSLDNRRENLRLATKAENQYNKRKTPNTKSGYKGVFYDKGKWRAVIQINRKKTYLGSFDTPELAHQAYCEAAKELFGEFANGG